MTRQEAIRRIKSLEQPKLFVYKKPGVMVGHNYTDDVAITYAATKEEAIEKFKEFYSDVNNENVSEPYFNYGGVAILTDY